MWGKSKIDVCGVCGGNTTSTAKCGNKPKIIKTGLIATGAFIGTALATIGAAVVLFFAYKRWRNGANWYIPNALLQDDQDSAVSNPGYVGDKDRQFTDSAAYVGIAQ
jgi:hypothetical protein